jgi:hypothetical protein
LRDRVDKGRLYRHDKNQVEGKGNDHDQIGVDYIQDNTEVIKLWHAKFYLVLSLSCVLSKQMTVICAENSLSSVQAESEHDKDPLVELWGVTEVLFG